MSIEFTCRLMLHVNHVPNPLSRLSQVGSHAAAAAAAAAVAAANDWQYPVQQTRQSPAPAPQAMGARATGTGPWQKPALQLLALASPGGGVVKTLLLTPWMCRKSKKTYRAIQPSCMNGSVAGY